MPFHRMMVMVPAHKPRQRVTAVHLQLLLSPEPGERCDVGVADRLLRDRFGGVRGEEPRDAIEGCETAGGVAACAWVGHIHVSAVRLQALLFVRGGVKKTACRCAHGGRNYFYLF
jgi:hypothetical protein